MNFLKYTFFCYIVFVKYCFALKDCGIEVAGNKIDLCKYTQTQTNPDFEQ